MASRIITSAGPAISQVLRAAIETQAAKGERTLDIGYNQGSPKRFAGEAFTKGSGIGGSFANFLKEPAGTQYGREFVSQWTSGPFRPDLGEDSLSTDTGVA